MKHINLRKYARDIGRAIRGECFNVDHGDVILFGDSFRLRGEYLHGTIGKHDFLADHNLVVDQGVITMWNVMFGSTSKISTWYLALNGGTGTPVNTWTAANYASNATEITATSPEGYSESVRQTITFANATSLDQIDNYSSRAVFTIVTASALNIYGAAALSSNVRGGTSGVLYSASKFAQTRVSNNGDALALGFRTIGTPT